MSLLDPSQLLRTVDGLLIPIQKSISAVLPDFVEENLKDPVVRQQVVLAADKILVEGHPEARLIPHATRHRIIAKSLAIILDDVLLNDQQQ